MGGRGSGGAHRPNRSHSASRKQVEGEIYVLEPGLRLRGFAKVKKHSEYRGTKQTEITGFYWKPVNTKESAA